jgi:hypothetical protein
MEYTNIDKSINLFFTEIGGLPALGLIFGSVIIISILIAVIKPFEI